MNHGQWESAVKQAMKVLGNKARIPDYPKSIEKSALDYNKAVDEFWNRKDQLRKLLVEAKKKMDGLSEDVEAFQAQIDRENFALNSSDKDELKKIKEARKILHANLQEALDDETEVNNGLRELDKHLNNMDGYVDQIKHGS